MPKDTTRNILSQQAIVVYSVEKETLKDVNETARFLGPNESELPYTQFHTTPSSVISVRGLLEPKVRFECILEKHVTFSSNDIVTTDLIIGRIVKYHIDESIYEQGRINIEKLEPISRLAGSNYSTLGEIIPMERPK